MANLKICKKCKFYRPKDNITILSFGWSSKKEWSCFSDGHRDIMGKNVMPEDSCPYKAEHIVSSNCDINSHDI